jgi:dynein heavy chain
VQAEIAAMGLQDVPAFRTKILQLYDTFNVRFGVMLVGPTGGGKSTCYSVLLRALNRLHAAVRAGRLRVLVGVLTRVVAQGAKPEVYHQVWTHLLNPKCISMGELYGEVDPITQEWSDGLASSIVREAIKDKVPGCAQANRPAPRRDPDRAASSAQTDDRHWVVFDGPVDSLWIENMNSVLDDSMTLCLSNGERIKVKSELRMLFEVQDLAVASPATVRCAAAAVPGPPVSAWRLARLSAGSRCGMVYLTPADMGVMPFFHSWLPTLHQVPLPERARVGVCCLTPAAAQNVNPALRTHLQELIEKFVPDGIKFVRANCKEPIPTVDVNLAANFCRVRTVCAGVPWPVPLTPPLPRSCLARCSRPKTAWTSRVLRPSSCA